MIKPRSLKVSILFVILLAAAGCNKTRCEFPSEDGKVNHFWSVPVGDGTANIEFGVTEVSPVFVFGHAYPIAWIHYNSASEYVNGLKSIDVTLKADGRELKPDGETYDASFANTSLTLTKQECCAMLGDRLNVSPDMRSFSFSAEARKTYKSIRKLPRTLEIIVTVTTDRGTQETGKVLTLKEFEASGFFRFH